MQTNIGNTYCTWRRNFLAVDHTDYPHIYICTVFRSSLPRTTNPMRNLCRQYTKLHSLCPLARAGKMDAYFLICSNLFYYSPYYEFVLAELIWSMVEKIMQPILWSTIEDNNPRDYEGSQKKWFVSCVYFQETDFCPEELQHFQYCHRPQAPNLYSHPQI